MEDKDINEAQVEEVSIDTPAPDATPETQTPDDVPTENAEIVALQDKLNALHDKYLRLAAELENTRRRAALDAQSAARNRAMNIAKNFLPVMDAIEAALTHSPDDAGIIAMQRAMESAFAQVGIVRIESKGQQLNPQFHNAIQVIDGGDAAPNTIIEELQAGYMFGDTVMRTAMVVVAK